MAERWNWQKIFALSDWLSRYISANAKLKMVEIMFLNVDDVKIIIHMNYLLRAILQPLVIKWIVLTRHKRSWKVNISDSKWFQHQKTQNYWSFQKKTLQNVMKDEMSKVLWHVFKWPSKLTSQNDWMCLQNDLIQFKHHNSIFAGGKNNFLSYAKIAFIHLAKLFV